MFQSSTVDVDPALKTSRRYVRLSILSGTHKLAVYVYACKRSGRVESELSMWRRVRLQRLQNLFVVFGEEAWRVIGG